VGINKLGENCLKEETTFYSLYKEFEEKVAALRAECEHKRLSDWFIQTWFPNEQTGILVRVCRRCEKVIDVRRGRIEMKYSQNKTVKRIIFTDVEPEEIIEREV